MIDRNALALCTHFLLVLSITDGLLVVVGYEWTWCRSWGSLVHVFMDLETKEQLKKDFSFSEVR
jgi:hypothetical protein